MTRGEAEQLYCEVTASVPEGPVVQVSHDQPGEYGYVVLLLGDSYTVRLLRSDGWRCVCAMTLYTKRTPAGEGAT